MIEQTGVKSRPADARISGVSEVKVVAIDIPFGQIFELVIKVTAASVLVGVLLGLIGGSLYMIWRMR